MNSLASMIKTQIKEIRMFSEVLNSYIRNLYIRKKAAIRSEVMQARLIESLVQPFLFLALRALF